MSSDCPSSLTVSGFSAFSIRNPDPAPFKAVAVLPVGGLARIA